MQQAIPYRTWQPIPTTSRIDAPPNMDKLDGDKTTNPSDRLRNLIKENAVLVLGRRGCCMCHVVNRLLQGLGVNPVVYEVEEEKEVSVVEELAGISGGDDDRRLQFPAVFIGGRLVGGLDRLMAVHISGDLVPILKEAGALWL
ncbi:glutaredoxin-C9-like [Magnolia sinica]|uniref:glutaredoxin-C9-like n=1 Tax=Magnolia sinica TaxID=86752 RepID=UPI002657DB71|nr:glutaredoxin-C9-like [Magnolia sinica]